MANDQVSPARKAARDILLNELGALLPLTDEHYARLDRMERAIESALHNSSNRSKVFRAIEKGLKRWAQHCKDSDILPIETILGDDNTLQHALTDAVIEAACSQSVAPGLDVSELAGWLAVKMPSSINLHTSERTPLAQWLAERITEYVSAPPAVSTPRPSGHVEQVLKDAQEKVRPIVEHERQGENIGSKIMEFRMKGMNPQETFDFLLKRHQKLLEIEAGAVSTPRCPKCHQSDKLIIYPPTSMEPNIAVFCGQCNFSVKTDMTERGFALLAPLAQFFQPDAQPSPWVSTKERLPEDDSDVFAAIWWRNGDNPDYSRYAIHDCCYYEGGMGSGQKIFTDCIYCGRKNAPSKCPDCGRPICGDICQREHTQSFCTKKGAGSSQRQ